MTDDLARLARMFRQFADLEFRGESPTYERLARDLADAPELAGPLLAAPPGQRRALLYFAAAQYLIRTAVPEHPLRRYLRVLGGDRAPDDGLLTAFADLVATHGAALARICASRTTQTNEARRCALLRPALGRAAGDRPVALIELGTSAGLLLLPDRYAYHYTGARDERHGPAGALTLTCEVRGAGWPDHLDRGLRIAARTGIDLHPCDPADPDAVNWLRSCVWPEQTDRLARLDAALAEAAAVRPTLVPGDMVTALPGVLASVGDGVLPLVFASNALTYLPGATRAALVDLLAAEGTRRDLAVVVNEAARVGVRLFSAAAPAGPDAEAIGTLAVVAWRDGVPSVDVLAETAPHGAWLSWQPRSYPYGA